MPSRSSHAFASFALVSCVASTSWAIEPEVTSDTAAQFYDVRSPTGETVLTRRRLTSTLGVDAEDLLSNDKVMNERGLPELSFKARLRYDADFGADPAEADPTRFGRFVPGFDRGPADLMYAYIEGRKFAKGWLGFKVGRQYTTDALGWWSFDGGSVKITSPYYVAAEVYAGLEVRGGLPLSGSRFESDGVYRGDRTGFDPSLYPQFQPNDVAPAFGVALESVGPTWIHGRLSYRRVYNTGEVGTSDYANSINAPTTYDGTRISSEKVGYSMDANLGKVIGVKGGIVYDLYDAKVGSGYGTVDAFVTPELTAGVDYDFFAPTFDADSIWNFFAANPMNDVGAHVSWDFAKRWSASVSAHVKIFSAQTSAFNPNPSQNNPQKNGVDLNYYPSTPLTFDEGGALAVRYRSGQNTHGLRASGNTGDEGSKVGGDVFAERVYEVHYLVEARGSVWYWDDKIAANPNGTIGREAASVGGVLGAGYIFTPRTRAIAEYQLDDNRFSGLRSRVVLWLSVAGTKP